MADGLISRHLSPPFIAVVPVAGPNGRYAGEWAGPWEDYIVRDVVPWVDQHLPTLATTSARAAAGVSAGGYGAVDIGLRHPGLFGTLVSWGGYFYPFRDGPLARAGRSELEAHDPSLLVRAEAPVLRRLGVRFFLSSGPTHGAVPQSGTADFAHELAGLHLRYRLWLLPRGTKGVWRAQFEPGLVYALGDGKLG